MFPMDVPHIRNGHWECNGGLDWQGMAIGNTMKKKGSWGIGLDEDLHLPWWGMTSNVVVN
jgi:hypothetical protein